jgi:O-antigen/teichoic acid export membrane protein
MTQKTVPAAFVLRPVSRRRATVANLVYQYATIAMTMVNGIVLVPLYLKYIDYTLYGAWLSTGSIIAWLGLAEAGLNQVVKQQTAAVYGAQDIENAGRVIGTGVICNSAVGLLPVLIALVFAPVLPHLFGMQAAAASTLSLSFILAGASTTMVIVSGSAAAIQEGLQRNVSVCAVYTFSALVGLAVSVFMLINGHGLISIPLGLLVRSTAATILYWSITIFLLYRRMGVHLGFSMKQFKSIRGLTGWTFGDKVCYQLANQADVLVVGLFLGVETTPVYVLSKRSWDLVRLFLNRIGVAFLPSLSHLHGEGKVERFKEVSNKLLHHTGLLTIVAVGACIAFNRSFVYLWVGPDLYTGHLFDVLMGAYTLLAMIISVLYYVLYSSGRIRGPSISGIIQNSLRVLLLLVFGWLWGIPGMVLSLVVSAALVLPYLFGQYFDLLCKYPSGIFHGIKNFALPAIATIILTYVSLTMFVVSDWLRFIGELCLFIMGMALIFFLIDKTFRISIKQLM